MMGSAIFTTQYLQSVLGKSPLSAALWSLLPSVFIGFAGPVTAQLIQRGVNRGYVVAGGFAAMAAGYSMLALVGTDSLWLALAGAGVLACGMVAIVSQLTDLALSGAPVERAGTASSLLETSSEFGGALGMAVLGSIGTAVYRHEMPATAPAAARETLGDALATAARLPGAAGQSLLATAREAFTTGMQGAAIAGAALLVLAAVGAALTLRTIEVRDDEQGTRK
jgi:DHA2 family multidrug resistance protein-like MFS transporter